MYILYPQDPTLPPSPSLAPNPTQRSRKRTVQLTSLWHHLKKCQKGNNHTILSDVIINIEIHVLDYCEFTFLPWHIHVTVHEPKLPLEMLCIFCQSRDRYMNHVLPTRDLTEHSAICP